MMILVWLFIKEIDMVLTDIHKKSILYLYIHKGNCQNYIIRGFDCVDCFYFCADCYINESDENDTRYKRVLIDINQFFTKEELFEALL